MGRKKQRINQNVSGTAAIGGGGGGGDVIESDPSMLPLLSKASSATASKSSAVSESSTSSSTDLLLLHTKNNSMAHNFSSSMDTKTLTDTNNYSSTICTFLPNAPLSTVSAPSSFPLTDPRRMKLNPLSVTGTDTITAFATSTSNEPDRTISMSPSLDYQYDPKSDKTFMSKVPIARNSMIPVASNDNNNMNTHSTTMHFLSTSVNAGKIKTASSITTISSGYLTTFHRGDLIDEDIYVSDGSDMEQDDDGDLGNKDITNEEDIVGYNGEETDDDMFDSDKEEGDDYSNNNTLQKKTKETSHNYNNSTKTRPKKKVEEPAIDIILTTSRMGLIRKGSLHQQLLLQAHHQHLQSKQWIRSKDVNHVVTEGEDNNDDNEAEGVDDESKFKNKKPNESGFDEDRTDHQDEKSNRKKRMSEHMDDERMMETLDPVARAAYLLAEKQRKIYEAKLAARILESSENAGRDPCLFSKRTAFDIRMDQIEDKPWARRGGISTGDITDYFNYSLTEEDWMEYAERQLEVRQELTDASRQKRTPDPTIVPVVPRAPTKQQPRVAVAQKKEIKKGDEDDLLTNGSVVGPVIPNITNKTSTSNASRDGIESMSDDFNGTNKSLGLDSNHQDDFVNVPACGGAWGAGAAPGSVLAKLIEEQERVSSGKPPPPLHMMPPPPPFHLPPPPPVDVAMSKPSIQPPFHHPEPNLIGDKDTYGIRENNDDFHRQQQNRDNAFYRRNNLKQRDESNEVPPNATSIDADPMSMPPHQRHNEWHFRNNIARGPSQLAPPHQRFPLPPNVHRPPPSSQYPVPPHGPSPHGNFSSYGPPPPFVPPYEQDIRVPPPNHGRMGPPPGTPRGGQPWGEPSHYHPNQGQHGAIFPGRKRLREDMDQFSIDSSATSSASSFSGGKGGRFPSPMGGAPTPGGRFGNNNRR